MTIAPELLRRIVEGALLAAAQPLSEDKLLSLIDEGERPEKAALAEALQQIADSCAERGFELKQVASGWRFQVPEDLAPWVNRLWEEKPQKYSRAILETLAIIAYRQPITRGDIEEIRGVAVSSHIVKTLSERGWIKVVGQRDVPGKPSLYATTREFLDYFNLSTLNDLPTLAEIRDIDSLNQALDLGQLDGGAAELGEGADSAAGSGSNEEEADSVETETAESAAGDELSPEAAAIEEAAEDDELPHPREADGDVETEGVTDGAAEEIAEDEIAEHEIEGEESFAVEGAGEATETAQNTLTAELPPSSLFGDGGFEEPAEAVDGEQPDGTPDSTEAAETGDASPADESAGDESAGAESGNDAQMENTTL